MGKRKKKKRNLGPRRKRMRREARLQAAPKWRAGYGGKNVVRGYARWFGVDVLCAIAELRMLGVDVSAEYEQRAREAIAVRTAQRARQRAAKLTAATMRMPIDWPVDWTDEWGPSDEVAEPFDDIPF